MGGGSDRRWGALADTTLTRVREHMANTGEDGNSRRPGGLRQEGELAPVTFMSRTCRTHRPRAELFLPPAGSSCGPLHHRPQ